MSNVEGFPMFQQALQLPSSGSMSGGEGDSEVLAQIWEWVMCGR
jgi:hypothetical protein